MARYRRRRRFRRRVPRRRRARRLVKATMLDLDHIHNNSYIPTIGHTNATCTKTALLDIATGATSASRSGNRSVMHSFSLRGELSINSAATYTTVTYGIIYATKDLNGTTFDLANVFQDPDSKPWAFRNLNNLKDFKVCLKRTIHISTQYPSRMINLYYKPPPRQTKYSSNTTGSFSTGMYYFYAWSDESVNRPAFTAQYRIRYHR